MRLMGIASWVDYVPNETIITQGEQVQNLSLIYDGAVKVSKDCPEIAELSNLDFIGDMSFTTKNPASATVTTGVQTKVVSWPIDVLNRKLDSSTSLRSSLHAVIGVALTRKLVGNL